MAQHDYVIANGTGAAVRSDLNNALSAIVSQNSGATEPATMYAYQWWADTTTGLLKIRNAANNAWITLRELDGTLTIEDGTASSPGLAFADDLNTGIYSPSADQLGITTGGTVRLTTTTTGITSALPVDVPLGTASAPTVTFTGDLNTGIYSPGADQVAISTNGSGRLFINSSGSVGIGTSAPPSLCSIAGPAVTGTVGRLLQVYSSSATGVGSGSEIWLGWNPSNLNAGGGVTIGGIYNGTGADLVFSTPTNSSSAPAERVRIDSSGRLGIGTTSPQQALQVIGGARFGETGNNYYEVTISSGITYLNARSSSGSSGTHAFYTDSTERARIDSSGRLLVGTSSTSKTTSFVVQGNSANKTGTNSYAFLDLCSGNSSPADGEGLGYIDFQDATGTDNSSAARIFAQRDGGTWSASSKPGRLIFSTTASGSNTTTERMRITNDGYALFNTTNKALRDSTSDVGLSIDPGAGGLLQLAAGGPTYFNRVSSDGSIIAFRRNGANVGSISVTGSATAYNTSSDYRLKENVTAVTDGIARLQKLKPSRFNFIANPDTIVDGFIAHEVQDVVPEAIYGEKDATDDDGNPIYQGIDQSKLVPLLTAALQEAIGRIETLEAEVAALKAA